MDRIPNTAKSLLDGLVELAFTEAELKSYGRSVKLDAKVDGQKYDIFKTKRENYLNDMREKLLELRDHTGAIIHNYKGELFCYWGTYKILLEEQTGNSLIIKNNDLIHN